MKKILFAIAIVLTMTFGASAQGTDSFITNMDYEDTFIRDVVLPMLPVWGVGVFNDDQPATPLGSGLLVLTALGAGYAMTRRKRKN